MRVMASGDPKQFLGVSMSDVGRMFGWLVGGFEVHSGAKNMVPLGVFLGVTLFAQMKSKMSSTA